MGTFSRLEGKIPFEISDLSIKHPIRIGAKVDDGTPAPWFSGPLARASVKIGGDNSSFILTALYNSAGVLLPSLQTTEFVDGGWEGFFMIRRMNTIFNSFGLEIASLHPDENAIGIRRADERAELIAARDGQIERLRGEVARLSAEAGIHKRQAEALQRRVEELESEGRIEAARQTLSGL